MSSPRLMIYMACPSWCSFFSIMTGYSGILVHIDNSMKSRFWPHTSIDTTRGRSMPSEK